MTARTTLGRKQLGVLPVLWDDPESPELRAAAVEATARLPLSDDAWRALGDRVVVLLDDPAQRRALAPVARAAARVPLWSVRRRLRDVAQDGAHPGHHAAWAALSDVADETTLASDVMGVLREPLTGRTAHRLARLPLERLPVPATHIPGEPPSAATTEVQSWWTAVAAARLGSTGRLDAWLGELRRDPTRWPLPDRPGTTAALLDVLPLPDALLDHLARTLVRGEPVHDVLASVWLPGDTSDGAGDGGAPAPSDAYAAWLAGDASPGGWAETARLLGRAGPAALVRSLERWLTDPDAVTATAACVAIRDAAVLLDPRPVPTPLAEDTATTTAEPGGRSAVRGARPPTRAPASTRAVARMARIWRGIERAPSAAEPGAAERGTASPRYARLSCPAAVVVEEEFELEVGLAERPSAGAVSQPLALPARDGYALTVLVVVDGFRLHEGERPTVTLQVGPQDPYPTTTLRLSADASPGLAPVRSVLAVFSVDGVTVGSAARAVLVVPTRDDLPAGATGAPATGVDTAVPESRQAADLTVTISYGDDVAVRKLLWTFQSPHAAVTDTPEPLSCTLPERSEEFARRLMRSAGRAEGDKLTRLVRGAGKEIAGLVPPQVLAALQAVAAPDRPPTVLLLSAEPYVPWELASIAQPWVDAAPALLGAQAVVGRWALLSPAPTPDPPHEVAMQQMAVVSGVYEGVVGFKRLTWAEKEAEDLVNAYAAAPVNATQELFYACLDGTPPAQVLHVALHGKFDPTGLQDGLVLVDGSVVEPQEIRGSTLEPNRPFVFLNACQVGQAGETLGQYGGMAQAFVAAGASAVVAPLWVVQDDVARDVSLRFYDAVFAGTPPAEFLRQERARMQDSGTHLAYVLYGHPRLRLGRSREGAQTDGGPGS